MLFNSLAFFLFLPLVFTLYWGVFGRSLRWQNGFIVAASYLFYGWWEWRFLILIAITSAVAYLSGLGLAWRRHRGWVVASVVINVGILGFFKYFDFFQGQVVELLRLLGFQAHGWSLAVLLPVGISFYTFQSLSYTLDVWRGTLKPTRAPVAFFAFVSFFPQLVAGPIERAENLLPQFLAPRRFDYAEAVVGCRQMLWGFFKKVAVADLCAGLANRLLRDSGEMSSVSLAAGLFCFTFQIYGDFSGYSDIAIGCGRLFGIRLSRNFRAPYFSRDIAEFWRRWHISLTTWFRDYLYIPLGGSRCGRWQAIRNTFIVFLLSGLWHGANWTFLAWGAFHACCFLPLLLRGTNRRYLGPVAEGRWLPSVREVWQMGCTFALAALGWLFFRASTLAEAWAWLQKLFLGFDFSLDPLRRIAYWRVFPAVGLLLICEWVNRTEAFGCARYPRWRPLRWLCYLALVAFTFFWLSPPQVFIYFQF
ncbi:MAG: MBOAT family O-acyltransferase [Candidatus Spyradenecus sp.]